VKSPAGSPVASTSISPVVSVAVTSAAAAAADSDNFRIEDY